MNLKKGDVFVAGTFSHGGWHVGLLCEVKGRTDQIIKAEVINGYWDIEFDAITGRARIDQGGERVLEYTYLLNGPFKHHTYKNRGHYEVDYHGVFEEVQKRLDAVEGQNPDAPPSIIPILPQTAVDRKEGDAAFLNLIQATKTWATKHMDQWEKFSFSTPHGPIYVTISMEAKFPQSFDEVDDVLKNG